MSFKINDSLSCTILINKKELVLETPNQLSMMHITSSTQIGLPVLNFQYIDTAKLTTGLNLQDGVQITVSLSGPINVTRNFRVVSWARGEVGDGFEYSVEAIWDSPKYFIGTSMNCIEASSSDALKKIAELCKIKWYQKNLLTKDKMVWSQGNRVYMMFARDIAQNAYADSKSHIVLGVDSVGQMRFIDINRNPKPTISVGPLNPPQNNGEFLLITNFKPVSVSGLNNSLLGYRHVRVVQKMKPELLQNAEFVSDSKYPAINADVRNIQGRGMISYAPVDWGNVHPDYEKARYQNSRFDSLNSIAGEFLFQNQTQIEICDNFNHVATPDIKNTDYNGEFTVTSKTIFILGTIYQEKIVAVRNGLGA